MWYIKWNLTAVRFNKAGSFQLPQGVTKTPCEFRCARAQSNINKHLVSCWVLNACYGASCWLAHRKTPLNTETCMKRFFSSTWSLLPRCSDSVTVLLVTYIHRWCTRSLECSGGTPKAVTSLPFVGFTRCHRCLKFKPRERLRDDLWLGCVHISTSSILTFRNFNFRRVWILLDREQGTMELHLIALFSIIVLGASQAFPAPVGKWLFSASLDSSETHCYETREQCARDRWTLCAHAKRHYLFTLDTPREQLRGTH